MKKNFARSACWAAVALALLAASPAGAVDWYTGDKTSEPDYAPSIVLDASGSVAKKSEFGAVAVTGALDGNLSQSGVLGRAEFIGGGYQYNSNTSVTEQVASVQLANGGYIDGDITIGMNRRIEATQLSGGALVGYQWVLHNWTFALFGGLQTVNTNLSPVDVNNQTRGLHIGGKIVGEIYGNPSERTMLSGYASYGSANNDYYSRFKAGYAIAERVFIGPEFLALGDQFYTEYRAGLHVTGVKLNNLSLGVSGGATSNSVTGSGAYGIVDARLGF